MGTTSKTKIPKAISKFATETEAERRQRRLSDMLKWGAKASAITPGAYHADPIHIPGYPKIGQREGDK